MRSRRLVRKANRNIRKLKKSNKKVKNLSKRYKKYSKKYSKKNKRILAQRAALDGKSGYSAGSGVDRYIELTKKRNNIKDKIYAERDIALQKTRLLKELVQEIGWRMAMTSSEADKDRLTQIYSNILSIVASSENVNDVITDYSE